MPRRRAFVRPAGLPWLALALFFLVVGTPADAHAQTVRGTVVGEDGRPLPGVVVTVRGPGGERRIMSDAQGRFAAPGLPPGRYVVEAALAGFGRVSAEIDVVPGQSATLELRFDPGREPASLDPPIFFEPDTAPPVYNAEFRPLLGRDPIRIVSDEPTVLAFDIGPAREASVLGGDLTISRVIEAADEPTPLTVALDCFVCAEGENQLATITYDPDSRTSDQALFEFTARRALVEDAGGLGRVVVTVLLEGVELDVIEIPLIVGFASDQALDAYEPPARYTVGAFPEGVVDPPDLVLFVGPGAGSERLPLRLLPLDSALRTRVAGALGSSATSFPFRSGVTAAELEDLARQAYLDLSDIVLARNPVLDSLYAPTLGGSVRPSSTLRFSPRDSSDVVGRLDDTGRQLYLRLFEDGDPGLPLAMAALEAYARERAARGDPVRMRIHNKGPWAPWQLLTSTLSGAAADPEAFWGMRYAVGVAQDARGAGGRVRTLLGWPMDGDLVLATHQQDPILRPGAQRLGQLLMDRTSADLHRHDQRDPFLAELRQRAAALKFLLFFTHGSAGSGITGMPALGPNPRLHFSASEVVEPPDIDALRRVLTPDERRNQVRVFRAQPVVFLNTCESGTTGLQPANNNHFVGTFLRNGASSVIATESAVWVAFAHDFGTDVIDGIFAGLSVASALQQARVKHLRERGNPLGLIYSLYGNPSARFAVPVDGG